MSEGMKNWVVTLAFGNVMSGERFETKEQAIEYAKILSVKPSYQGLAIGVYKLENYALYEPKPEVWTVHHPED